MFPGQPAAASSKLQIGDIILQVNRNDMQGVTHQEAINLIRMGPQEVKLLVKREPSSIPSSLLQRSGSNASDIDPAHILADIQSKLQIDPPSLKKESFDSTGSEVPSTKPDSLDLGDETPKRQEEVAVEAHVSLRSSLLSNVSTKSSLSQSSHPGLASRFSEPVTIMSNAHDPIETTNFLPNTMSRLSRQGAIQQTSQEDKGASMLSLGAAPLAEDESSDVEDSRRSSSIDVIAPNRSIYDEYSVRGLTEKLLSVELSEEHREDDGAQESEETSLTSVEPAFPILPVLQDDVAPSPSSDSDVSDVEEIPLSAEGKQHEKSESLTPQDEVS